MKFALIDRILELESHRILAVKSATLSEDYLHDHFPGFPVMPGVLMLESMYQAAAWLVRRADDFAHSIVLMKEARNVKYSGLVRPGEQLLVEAHLLSQDDAASKLKVECRIGNQSVASGRLVLACRNLADKDPTQGDPTQADPAQTDPAQADTDRDICRHMRSQFEVLAPANSVS